MQLSSGTATIARSIQLAVAPVFLLSAVGAVLAVLTNRLGRIIDRARVLSEGPPHASDGEANLAQGELEHLSRRARFIQWAITLCTVCALIISLVIVTLFAGAALQRDLARMIAVLFIAGLCALIGAFIFFLFEIQTATSSIRFGKGRQRT